jgi:outer membrane protein assembly factor BamB
MNGSRSKYRALAASALASLLLGLSSCHEAPVSTTLVVQEIWNSEQQTSPGPWPGWRGGVQHGQSPAEASRELDGNLHPYWKTSLPGAGNSSPVLVDDLILLTAETTPPGYEESSAGRHLAILAFDAHSGEERWRQVLGQGIGPTHDKAGYASATIAATGDRGFAFFGQAGLFGFSLEDGRLLWHHEYPENRHEWGIVSSPLLFRNLVIQLVDGEQGGSFLAAYEQATGRLVWRVERESVGCWTSPILLEGEKETYQLIVNGTGQKDGTTGWLIAYDPFQGKELWRARGTSDIPVPTALVWKNHVISASGGNGPLFSVRSDGQGDVTATHVRWKIPTGGAYVPSGLVMGDRLYLLMDHGKLVCRDAATGDLLGRQRLPGPFTASLVGAAGYLFAVSEAGDISILQKGEEMEVIRTIPLHERVLATPAIAGERLFLRTAQHLYCFGPATRAGEDPLDAASVSTVPAAFTPGQLERQFELTEAESSAQQTVDSLRVPDEIP